MTLLPFDETGQLASNLKTETHVISSINGVNYQFILPDWAPFFKTGFSIFHEESGRYLEDGVDFFFSHYFEEADEAIAEKVYGSITLLDVNMTGTFHLQLQSLGGEFVTNVTQALESGLSTLAEMQSIRWEDIITPAEFPPTSHEHVVTDLEGVNRVIEELTLIRQSIEARLNELTMEDISDLDTGYIQPLMTNLNSLTAAILANGTGGATLFYEKAFFTNIGGVEDIIIGSQAADTWFDTPLSVVVVEPGMYKIDHSLDPLVDSAVESISYRWVLNNTVVSRSYANGISHAIPANTNLKLQMRLNGAGSSQTVICDTSRGAVLTATRLGN